MTRSALCLLTFPLLTLSLTQCGGGPGYKITLRDGREIQTLAKPEFKGKTGYYQYRNTDRKDGLVRADEVMLIEEQES